MKTSTYYTIATILIIIILSYLTIEIVSIQKKIKETEKEMIRLKREIRENEKQNRYDYSDLDDYGFYSSPPR